MSPREQSLDIKIYSHPLLGCLYSFMHQRLRLIRTSPLEKRRTPITPSQPSKREKMLCRHTIGLDDKGRETFQFFSFYGRVPFKCLVLLFSRLGVNLQKFLLEKYQRSGEVNPTRVSWKLRTRGMRPFKATERGRQRGSETLFWNISPSAGSQEWPKSAPVIPAYFSI